MRLRSTLASIALVVGMTGLQGCAHPAREAAVPNDRITEAVVPGIPNSRYWFELDLDPLVAEFAARYERQKRYLARSGHRGPPPTDYFLSISGGGDQGAFGAGLLAGWSENGTRPQFTIVTGISTGALIAPFAFLGPDYDDEMAAVFTGVTADDIFTRRDLFAAFFDDALADSQPLRELIARHITEEILRKVAAEYRDGRMLLIGTTNLDAREPVVWNMGAIAASGNPKALELFREVLLASASIPGIFPPIMIDVDVGADRYQEMHVDGGAKTQVFVYPGQLDVRKEAEARGIVRKRTLFIIRNAPLHLEGEMVERRTLDIGKAALGSLIRVQGIGDLNTIYLLTQRDGIDYNFAYIDDGFTVPHGKSFDQAYMRQLFQYGYDLGRKGYPWRKRPPALKKSLRPSS